MVKDRPRRAIAPPRHGQAKRRQRGTAIESAQQHIDHTGGDGDTDQTLTPVGCLEPVCPGAIHLIRGIEFGLLNQQVRLPTDSINRLD
ncbi:hypothetical protein XM38_043790 [Halomicronema hongdechloris C2206]|uniref:Uncharacterized protein n=1 Tax=Halomicronema hongdechloris C2206 TaxID=1641165 RepID=A0A1Z3HT37_9CYAN|nr:hypothetical protein XM38_043790 [Halomicronema hongdechloris C2206]